jgi:hypothetical protein
MMEAGQVTLRESAMGFFSWFTSCGTVGDDEPPSLLHTNYEDPDLDEVQRQAEEDVARVQQDDKYFRGNSPDEL